MDEPILSQAKIDELKEKLNKPQPSEGTEIIPNLADFDYDPQYEHLYKRCRVVIENGVEKWVVNLKEWATASKTYNGTGEDDEGRPKGLGDFMTAMENGPEGWKVFNVLPNGSGLGAVVFVRTVRMALPTPKPLKTTVEVAAPTEGDIQETEKKVADWVDSLGDETLKESVGSEGSVEGD